MILWTIQTEEAWSELQVGGMLHVTRENITESNWIHPYEWIIDQMKMRLGPPPEPGCFPIWAWYQWENEHADSGENATYSGNNFTTYPFIQFPC